MKILSLIFPVLFLLACSAGNKSQIASLSSSLLSAAGINVSSSGVSSLMQAGEKIALASRGLSEEQEYYLGRTVSAMIMNRYALSSDSAKLRYVNQVGKYLSVYSPRPETFNGYYFGILQSPEINAVSAPGGFVLVSEGMVAKLSSEDELAAVLAHEIAHVAYGHGVAAISQANITSALSSVGQEALNSSGDFVAQQLLSTFSDSAKEVFDSLLVKGYSRSQEYEADLLAVSILEQSGYQPYALINVLKMLESNQQPSGGWYDTHPEAKSRIEELEETISLKSVDTEKKGYQFRSARFQKVF